MFKLKEHEKAAFFSSPENRCHLASSLKPEEREFVVEISKKDLSEAEMDTLTKSCSPTPMVKCKRMKRQLCMSKNWIYS